MTLIIIIIAIVLIVVWLSSSKSKPTSSNSESQKEMHAKINELGFEGILHNRISYIIDGIIEYHERLRILEDFYEDSYGFL